MIENVKDIWRNDYYNNSDSEQQTEAISPTDDILDQYLRRTATSNSDSFNAFMKGLIIEFGQGMGADVYSWLRDNCSPSVQQHAFDLLSIPAMSAEVERVFSSAKLLITPQRNSLSQERIEYLELLRYWWRNNLISQRR
jgi:hAT family C-terminal dimerisation region